MKGRLDSALCCIKNPLTGHVVIESCDAPIKSVEIQLVRVETCGCAEGYARDGRLFHPFASEVLCNVKPGHCTFLMLLSD